MLEGNTVALFQGRVHLYEGYAPSAVVLPIALLWQLGVESVVLTNAAGGISPGLAEGALMLIRDHINLTGQNPLIGLEDRRLRFPKIKASPSREAFSKLQTALDQKLYRRAI